MLNETMLEIGEQVTLEIPGTLVIEGTRIDLEKPVN